LAEFAVPCYRAMGRVHIEFLSASISLKAIIQVVVRASSTQLHPASGFIGHTRQSEITAIFQPLVKEFYSCTLYENVFRPCYSLSLLIEDISTDRSTGNAKHVFRVLCNPINKISYSLLLTILIISFFVCAITIFIIFSLNFTH
jgi:hypothetical protein